MSWEGGAKRSEQPAQGRAPAPDRLSPELEISPRRDCDRGDSPKIRSCHRRARRSTGSGSAADYRRFERRLPGQGDRRGRQSAARVGVVRRIRLEVAPPQIAVELCAKAVDHGGIGLERHADPQTVDEHGRDQGPVCGACRLLFDDRRQDQRRVRILSGVSGARRPHAASSRCRMRRWARVSSARSDKPAAKK